ncbi:DoxX family protein [Terrimonas sp.]|uniref:DoxX family protein n=1 Tax=Terrimonas sp. TaxID=1914338 RepID=UPI000D509430|nr:DoxX family protein [Terrimonas sp.]PVD52736.1 DoxX family protein [Terrimonas sp.]
MSLIQNIERWGEAHHPKWLDLVRAVLGFFLFLKGVDFINNMEVLTAMMAKSDFLGSLSLGLLAHYVVLGHLVGGAMIAAGLLTRLACLVQIPILAGAILFVNASAGILAPYSALWISVIVLALLIYFVIIGSGPLSVDEWMRGQPLK